MCGSGEGAALSGSATLWAVVLGASLIWSVTPPHTQPPSPTSPTDPPLLLTLTLQGMR